MGYFSKTPILHNINYVTKAGKKKTMLIAWFSNI